MSRFVLNPSLLFSISCLFNNDDKIIFICNEDKLLILTVANLRSFIFIWYKSSIKTLNEADNKTDNLSNRPTGREGAKKNSRFQALVF